MEKRNPLKIYETENQSVVNLSDGKIPPQAIDLEEAVLGAMLIDEKGVNEIIEWIFIISAFIPFSANFSEALIASHTKCPVATMVTSFPSFNFKPFPILNFSDELVKFATLGLPNLKYTGPSKFEISIVADFV